MNTTAQTLPPWSPDSWRALPAAQQPDWPDAAAVDAVTAELKAMPPLVFAGEARQLRRALAEVAAGRGFLLQSGDCAESFRDLTAPRIRDNLKIMLQMATVLTYGAALPVVKLADESGVKIQAVGRANTPFASQYHLSSLDCQAETIALEVHKAMTRDTPVDIKVKPQMIYRASCPEKK